MKFFIGKNINFRFLLINQNLKLMISKKIIFFIILIGSTGIVASANAEPTVTIIMEKTTYTYCEKLVYSIEVSEITGEYFFNSKIKELWNNALIQFPVKPR